MKMELKPVLRKIKQEEVQPGDLLILRGSTFLVVSDEVGDKKIKVIVPLNQGTPRVVNFKDKEVYGQLLKKYEVVLTQGLEEEEDGV